MEPSGPFNVNSATAHHIQTPSSTRYRNLIKRFHFIYNFSKPRVLESFFGRNSLLWVHL
jgi:hypothetical protein